MSARSKPKREGEVTAELERETSELPKGWAIARLDELTESPKLAIVSGPFGSNLKSSEYVEKGVPLIRLQNIDRAVFLEKNIRFITQEKADELASHSFVSGDVVISKLGDPVGKACIVPKSLSAGVIVADVVRARIDERRALSNYVVLAINSPSVISQVNLEVKGSTRPRVNLSNIREMRIPLAPLAEQRRIVAKLELLFRKVSSNQQRLSRVPGLLKRFRQSVLAAACSGKLTADWREENPKTPTFETDGNHDDELPTTWLQTTLGPLIELVTSGSRGWAKYYADSGSIFIRAQNINSDMLSLDDIAFVSLPNKAEGLRTRVQKDDILVTITGANVTKSALVNYDLDDAYVSQHVALVRLADRRLAPFLFHWIVSTAHGRKQLLESAYGQGKPGLNLDNIRDVAIAIPPLAEQQEIVRRVEKLFAFADQIEARLKQAQAHVDRLTQSILAKAFRGQLVPQNPGDVPASVLLDKLRAERESMKRKTSKKVN